MLGRLGGTGGALAVWSVPIAEWRYAEIQAAETAIHANYRALAGLLDVLVERMSHFR